ncbi:DUF6203 family protein [Nonomuraea dietziae]|uniref:DUF6203 family protein n=1 Tax=Nonomuraea dietziae TaxID=65515 RepID=UPI0033E9FF5B
MRKFFKFVMARWLARTPIGLAVLAAGWVLGRWRRRRVQQEGQRGTPVRERPVRQEGQRSRPVRGRSRRR